MDHGDHFQLCIKLDPFPKYGLFNGKQQTARDCFHELSEMEPCVMERHELQTKNFLLFMSV